MVTDTTPVNVLEQRVGDSRITDISGNPKTDTQSIKVVGFNTRDNSPNSKYHWYHQLNEDERRLDRGDTPFFEIIDAMSREEWNSVNKVLAQKLDPITSTNPHYYRKQREWINYARERFEKNYGAEHGVPPTSDQFLDHAKERGLFERYRVFYVAKYFNDIEINNGLNHPQYGPVNSEDLRIAEDFIMDIMDVRLGIGLAFVSD